TPEGPGIVVDRQVLTQLVMVEFEDMRRVTFPIEDLTSAPAEPVREEEAVETDGNGHGAEEREEAPSRTEEMRDPPQMPPRMSADDRGGEQRGESPRGGQEDGGRQGRGRRRRRRRGGPPRGGGGEGEHAG